MSRSPRVFLVLAVVIGSSLATTATALASPGDLDATFGGGDGVVTTAIGTVDQAFGMTIDASGRILVVGSAFATGTKKDFAIARYDAGGTLDPTFGGGDGVVTTNFSTGSYDEAFDVSVDATGRIVAAGTSTSGTQSDFAVARYLDDGSLDPSFDGDGKVVTDVAGGADVANALAIAGGGVVVAGGAFTGATTDFAVVRYTDAGALDASFDGDGVATTDFAGGNDVATAIATDAGGNYVVGGSAENGANKDDFALARYDATGALDPKLDTDGKLVTTGNDQARDLAIDAAGRIVLAGSAFTGSTLDFALLRLKDNGSVDTTFGAHGRVTTAIGTGSDVAEAVAIDGNGTIVAAGTAASGTDRDIAVARYAPNGQLLRLFGGGGTASTNLGPADSARAVAFDGNGDIIVSGYATTSANADFATLRFLGTGFRTDATIRRLGDFNATGDDVYNTTGQGQMRTAKAKLGTSVTFTYAVQNEGTAADAFTVAGCKDSAGFTVAYNAGGTDVTAEVVAGTYNLGPVDVGSARSLQVAISVTSGAVAGTAKTCKLSATSQGDPGSTDVAKAKVKAIA
jgi:uncharacterized delta-60 repeat protein